jgi:HEAT repeat protein
LYAKYESPKVASAVPGLCEALQDSDTQVRWWAAHALAAFKEKAKAAVPHLIETLKDADQSVRGEAVTALGKIGAEPGVVQALIGMLHDSDPHIRRASAESLGNLGPAARAAIPALEALRHGAYEFVDRAVAEAIENISETKK